MAVLWVEPAYNDPPTPTLVVELPNMTSVGATPDPSGGYLMGNRPVATSKIFRRGQGKRSCSVAVLWVEPADNDPPTPTLVVELPNMTSVGATHPWRDFSCPLALQVDQVAVVAQV